MPALERGVILATARTLLAGKPEILSKLERGLRYEVPRWLCPFCSAVLLLWRRLVLVLVLVLRQWRRRVTERKQPGSLLTYPAGNCRHCPTTASSKCARALSRAGG